MSLLSDLEWEAIYTADEAEKDLGNGFVFRGCGWYFEGEEVLLVMPEDVEMPWNQDRAPRRVYMHFCQNPARWFNAIVNAPTREDLR